METTTLPRQRMTNPVLVLPDAMKALAALAKATDDTAVSTRTLDLVHLRASQINGCAFCVEMHAGDLKKAGESDERIYAVAAWRESPYFTDAERAVLALTEAATRINDKPDPVPDEIWEEVARHFDERALAALVIHIALINAYNRINVMVKQKAGPWRSNGSANTQ